METKLNDSCGFRVINTHAKSSMNIKLFFSIVIIFILVAISVFVIADGDKDTLTITVADNITNTKLPNAKFTIKKVVTKDDGTEEEQDAQDFDGNLVGNVENINGTEYRVVTTNNKGEVKVELPAGRYKVTQVKATDGYELNAKNTYEVTLISEGSYTLPTVNQEWKNYYDEMKIIDIEETEDGYLALAEANNYSEIVIPAKDTTSKEDIYINSRNFILEYDENNKIRNVILLEEDDYLYSKMWGKVSDRIIMYEYNYIKILNDNGEQLLEINKLSLFNIYRLKNEIIFDMDMHEDSVIPKEFMQTNEDTILENTKAYLLKINDQGKIEIVEIFNESFAIGDIKENTENHKFVFLSIYENITIPKEETANNEEINLQGGNYIIEIDQNGKVNNIVTQAKFLMDEYGDYINLIYSDSYMLIIQCYNDFNADGQFTSNGEKIEFKQGYNLCIFDEYGKIKWLYNNEDNLIDYRPLKIDNGYLINAYLENNIDASQTYSGKEITIEQGKPYAIKFSEDGKIMWAQKLEVNLDNEVLLPIDVIALGNGKYVNLYEFDKITSGSIPKSLDPETEMSLVEIQSALIEYKENLEEKFLIEKQNLNVQNSIADTLEITKLEEETGTNLPGAKFTINKVTIDENGNKKLEEALDIYGNQIGNIENINGTEYRVVTTDSNGKIGLKLPVGKYEVTEVKAPEGYLLDENNTYTVDISINKKYVLNVKVSEIFKKEYSKDFLLCDIKEISKEEYVVLASVMAKYTISAQETVNNQEISLEADNSYLIKYNKENKIEEAIKLENMSIYDSNIILNASDKNILLYNESNSTLECLNSDDKIVKKLMYENMKFIKDEPYTSINTDDGIILLAYTYGVQTISAEDTIDNKEIILGKENDVTNVLIKITNDYKIKVIFEFEQKIIEPVFMNYLDNNNFYIGVTSYENLTIPSELAQNNEEIKLLQGESYYLELNYDGEITGVNVINLEKYFELLDDNYYIIQVIDMIPLKNEESLSRIFANENVVISSEYTSNGEEIKLEQGANIIKYNKNYEIEWVVYLGEDIDYIQEISDGYLCITYMDRNINAEDTLYGNEIIITDPKIMELKINKEGKIVWAIDLVDNENRNWIPNKIIEIGDKEYVHCRTISFDKNIEITNYIQVIKEEDETLDIIGKKTLNIENKQIETPEDPDNPHDPNDPEDPDNTEDPGDIENPNIGIVVVRYLDRETNTELLPTEHMEYSIGARYATTGKDIQYYKLEETPENAEGTVEEGVTEVIYYYDKQDFNIQTDKTISKMYLNGEEQNLSDTNKNIFQVSIHRTEIPNAELKISYTIKITNTGEIPGTAGKVTDMIPEGLEFFAEDNEDYWSMENGYAVSNILDGEIINPGESRELEIVLRCENVEENIGLKTNRAVAENTKNEAEFDETTTEDNEAGCRLIVTPSLGLEDYVMDNVIKLLVSLVIAGVLMINLKVKEKRKIHNK